MKLPRLRIPSGVRLPRLRLPAGGRLPRVPFRFRLPTLLETVFAVAIVLMAWHAVVPTIRRARDAARVDIASMSLHQCDRMVRHMLRDGDLADRADATLDAVERRLADENAAAVVAADDDESDVARRIVWPAGTDRASFDPCGPGGCAIRVALGDGTSVLVTAASNHVDHAN